MNKMTENRPSLLKVYTILMKPRVVLLLQATAICGVLTYDFKEGYELGREYTDSLRSSMIVLLGGSLASGGSMAINMWYERDLDPLMKRTENRPIPSGHISPNHALIFGLIVCLLGIGIVAILANKEAGMITAFSAFFYVCIYTMILNRRTPQHIVIGGLSGSTPPLIGWVAASGDVYSSLPWLMVLTIFIWTPPHFWSLTLSKRRDYGEAGVPMLPVVRGEDVTRNHILGYAILLVTVNLAMIILGNLGLVFLIISLNLTGYFVYKSWSLCKSKTDDDAWALFKYSNLYLYSLFFAIIIDVMNYISISQFIS